jgi:hypothetical protein
MPMTDRMDKLTGQNAIMEWNRGRFIWSCALQRCAYHGSAYGLAYVYCLNSM